MTHSLLTQSLIDEAADVILVAGERPTVARVMAFVGTGTHESVEGLLEAWWEGLGGRLLARPAHAWDPPAEVTRVATALWEAAVSRANALQASVHREEQERLQHVVASLERRVAELEGTTRP